MHLVLWILIGIIVAVILAMLAILIYSREFGKKISKVNDRILELLDSGLLEHFRKNAPYDEVKDEYGEFIDLIDIFSQFVHFTSLREERIFKRQNEYLMLQYVKVNKQKVARFHFRAFPIKTLPEKLKPKEMMMDSFKRVEELLYRDKDIAYMEFITHDRLLNENTVKKFIEFGNLKLDYVYDNEYEKSYLPWIYSEWIMIHGGDNPKSEEVYKRIRKINRPINVKLYRQ